MTEVYDLIEQAKEESEELRNLALDAVNLFIEEAESVYSFEKAVRVVSEKLDVDTRGAADIVGHLASDDVDPLVHIPHDRERYVSVIEYEEGDWWYGYRDFDDVKYDARKVVCSQCVIEKDHPKDVGKVFEPDINGDFEEYEDMADWLYEHHFEKRHPDVDPASVGVHIGATLASGTTIGGNTALHGGNLSSFGVTSFGVGTLSNGEFVQNSAGTLTGSLPSNFYGDASDGTVTRSSNGNETGLVFADDYTIESGVTQTASNDVTVIHATNTITIDGTLDARGGGASGGGGATNAGGAGGVGNAGDYVGGFIEDSGGDGGDGTDAFGDPTFGGDGGEMPSPSASSNRINQLHQLLSPEYTNIYDLSAVAGSGGGGGGGGAVGNDTDNSGAKSGDGGDGGAGGGVIVLIAPEILGSGTITAAGNDGLDGGDASDFDYGGGGGGGGGSGGVIITATSNLSGPTIDVSGGSGGAGGSGNGAGDNGSNGQDGPTGLDIRV